MEMRIDYTPPEVDVEDVFPFDKHATIRHIDDEKIVVDQTQINYIILGLSCFGLSVFIYGFVFGDALKEPIIDWIIVSPIILGCIFFILKSTIGNKKVFVFNRKEGTISYPELLWGTSNTIPFSDACFIRNRVGPYAGEIFHLAILRADGITRSVISYDMPEKYLSLFVWYMDKNRPLPPGTAFDPYRQRDYERRKSEGFLAPLYPSRIDTLDIGPHPNRYKQKV